MLFVQLLLFGLPVPVGELGNVEVGGGFLRHLRVEEHPRVTGDLEREEAVGIVAGEPDDVQALLLRVFKNFRLLEGPVEGLGDLVLDLLGSVAADADRPGFAQVGDLVTAGKNFDDGIDGDGVGDFHGFLHHDGDGADGSCLGHVDGGGEGHDAHFDFTGEDCGGHVPVAVEGDVVDLVDARDFRDGLHDDVGSVAEAGDAHVDLAFLEGLRHVVKGLHFAVGAHEDGCGTLEGMPGRPLFPAGIGSFLDLEAAEASGSGGEHGVAVSREPEDVLGRDRAGCAGHVGHVDGFVQVLGHEGDHGPHGRVGAAAGTEADDDRGGSLGPDLVRREGGAAEGEGRNEDNGDNGSELLHNNHSFLSGIGICGTEAVFPPTLSGSPGFPPRHPSFSAGVPLPGGSGFRTAFPISSATGC
ncbi:hypothetical protein SDC9_48945 [bioreactor metagenome]|uniref:Uncharacterized protein n=1 Tax=bioreactor metagenome TaxID=1076179 RepID=A0A644WG31_9ZZZZ